MLGWTPAGCCAPQQQPRARPPGRLFSRRTGRGESSRLRLGAVTALQPLRCQNASTENRNTSGAAGWTRPPADTVLCSSANASPPPPQQGRGEKLAASTRVTYTEPGCAWSRASRRLGRNRLFVAASSKLWWSADLSSGCHLSSGFPQGQGWAAAIGSPGAFLGLRSGRFTTCRCRGCILVGHTLPSHPESRGEGRRARARRHRCLPHSTQSQRHFFWVPSCCQPSTREQDLCSRSPILRHSSPPSSRTFSSPTHGAG